MKAKKTKFPKKAAITKALKEFVKDEDGFVSKETILKIGLSVAAGMATFGAATNAEAQVHTNNVGPVSGCLQHTNSVSHSSY